MTTVNERLNSGSADRARLAEWERRAFTAFRLRRDPPRAVHRPPRHVAPKRPSPLPCGFRITVDVPLAVKG